MSKSPPSTTFERLARRAEALSSPSRPLSPVAGVTLLRHQTPTVAEGTVYQPIACLILRGKKETAFNGAKVSVRAGEVLLVSHDVPIVARVVEAPYLALVFQLELATLRGLYDEVGDTVGGERAANALQVRGADEALLDALDRHLALAAAPADARVLGPMLRREIHYRLLAAPFGGMLRNLLRHDSHASAVARAISILRRDFRAPVVVADLAREVGMSVSAFHKHFKAVTSSSPLQYQKDLRLLEARQLLRAGAAAVTAVAFDVGYESPSQFSREYARRFGRPPSRDAEAQPQRHARGAA